MLADNALKKFGQQIILLEIFVEILASESQSKLSSFKLNTGFLRAVVIFLKDQIQNQFTRAK